MIHLQLTLSHMCLQSCNHSFSQFKWSKVLTLLLCVAVRTTMNTDKRKKSREQPEDVRQRIIDKHENNLKANKSISRDLDVPCVHHVQ